jgi:hypothetical protein
MAKSKRIPEVGKILVSPDALPDDPLRQPARGRPGNLRGGVMKTGKLKPENAKSRKK